MVGFFNSAAKKADGSFYQDVFFKSPAGLCILTHPDFEIKLVNESFAKVFGKTKRDITGKLFVCVWEKCPERDEFFTTLRKEGSVNCIVCGDVMFSGTVMDENNYIITAVRIK
ncbi:PAS domain-containing protein [Methanomicrobium mobile]|uniref:PAS domain-containing protein n=1 Tax=Methanomicrobium mobile TaxID=2205 RepID=UPI0005B2ADD4|nr:PAS domain-containing protein [Methanomicrobium mobile]